MRKADWMLVSSVWIVGSILEEGFWMSLAMFLMGLLAMILQFSRHSGDKSE